MSCRSSVAIGRGLSRQTGRLSDRSRRLLTLRSGHGEGVLVTDRESGCLRLRGAVLLLLLLLRGSCKLLRLKRDPVLLLLLLLLLLRDLTWLWLLRSRHGLGGLRKGAILLLLLWELTWL
jgi:hypothetical protein